MFGRRRKKKFNKRCRSASQKYSKSFNNRSPTIIMK